MRVVVSVPPEGAGERLDRFVAGLAEVGSRGAAERLLAEGRVLVDGSAQPKSRRLAGGEELALELPEAVAAVAAGAAERSGSRTRTSTSSSWTSPPGSWCTRVPAARRDARRRHAAHGAAGGDPERPGIVHRLDRETSGLLVVARSEEAYAALCRLVRARGLTREYLALVRGRPKSRRGTVDAPIGRDRRDPLRRSLDTEAPKPAVTHFEVEEIVGEHTLLRVRLETGRTHQIRVHLAAIDLPVAGDPLYGVRRDLGLRRQFLHAARLAFEHPVRAREVDVTSPLPDELAAALTRARADLPPRGTRRPLPRAAAAADRTRAGGRRGSRGLLLRPDELVAHVGVAQRCGDGGPVGRRAVVVLAHDDQHGTGDARCERERRLRPASGMSVDGGQPA